MGGFVMSIISGTITSLTMDVEGIRLHAFDITSECWVMDGTRPNLSRSMNFFNSDKPTEYYRAATC